MRVRVLVNPTAGSGSSARRLPLALQELKRAGIHADVAETRGPGDAARLVREGHGDGVDCVALMGGDGTLNEASQAFIDPAGNLLPGPALALLPSGTGGDFRKSFGLGTQVEEAIARLVSSPPRRVDLGVLELCGHDGRPLIRSFINIASFGIGGLTDRIVNSSPKWMGGRTAFALGTLRALAVYRNADVRVRVDDQPWIEGPIFNVAIANGRYFGGGMLIAPDADPSDGALDVVAMMDLSALESVSLSPQVYRGQHLGHSKVRASRGQRVTAEALAPRKEVLIDMDGETPGRLPLVARVLPSALRIHI